MTAHDDHGTLPSHATTLLNRLEQLPGLFAPAETSHIQHMEYAQRAALLADALRGAWAAAVDARYAAALVVTRTAFEHHLLDRLLFLANRWVQTWGVKAADVVAEEKRLAGLKAGPRPDILRWWHDQRTGDMNVVIRGLFPEGSRGRGATLSAYYFRVDQYDPFIIGRRLAVHTGTMGPVPGLWGAVRIGPVVHRFNTFGLGESESVELLRRQLSKTG